MSHEVFSEPWARAWADEIRGSDDYRRAARKWEGSLVLEMTADENGRFVGRDDYVRILRRNRIDKTEFEASVREGLTKFFRRALARPVEDRFDHAEAMRAGLTSKPAPAPAGRPVSVSVTGSV